MLSDLDLRMLRSRHRKVDEDKIDISTLLTIHAFKCKENLQKPVLEGW